MSYWFNESLLYHYILYCKRVNLPSYAKVTKSKEITLQLLTFC